MKLKELKNKQPDNWFTLKQIAHPTDMQVWIKGEYDRTEKKYCCTCFGDISKSRLIDGNREVYTDFIF